MFLVYLDNNKGSKKKSRAVVKAWDSEGCFTWFELRHDAETGRPYLGRRILEVDEHNINPDDPISEHQSDTDEDLKQEEQKDVTMIQQSPINAPPTL